MIQHRYTEVSNASVSYNKRDEGYGGWEGNAQSLLLPLLS